MAILRKVNKGGVWVDEKVTTREMKQTIMKANRWTEEEYRKKYDIFKNKLRFYENIQRSRGKSVETQSPQEVLYKSARSKLRYGEDYDPSRELREIESLTAHSITKGRKIAAATSSESYKRAVSKIVNIRFAGFVDYYKRAQDIVNGVPLTPESGALAIEEACSVQGADPSNIREIGGRYFDGDTGEALYEVLNGRPMKPIEDPVAQEQALAAFAEYLHNKYPRAGKDKGAPTKTGAGGFIEGETYGSGDDDAGYDFDYSAWLM